MGLSKLGLYASQAPLFAEHVQDNTAIFNPQSPRSVWWLVGPVSPLDTIASSVMQARHAKRPGLRGL